MARYTGPKDKLSRREGFDLFGKGANLTRLAVPPGVHGQRRSRKQSQYGEQLREKQKVKRMYGLMEKQFKSLYEEASKTKGNTGERLLALLEARLDNVIYRLGFAPSRPSARQLVSHKFVMVNGKLVNVPSYRVKEGDTVGITMAASNIPAVKKAMADKDHKLPGWLKKKALIGKISRGLIRDDITEPITEQYIIEFYSR
ncbi:30S ribosomal protein S4 [Patescibacteria group bacterium]